MTVRYDSLLVRALGLEIENAWKGKEIAGVRFERSREQVLVVWADASALLFRLERRAGHTLRLTDVPAPKGKETFARRGLHISAVAVPTEERVLVLTLSGRDGQPLSRLVVELRPRGWSAALLKASNEEILAVLHTGSRARRRLAVGQTYAAPVSTRLWADRLPEPDEWTEHLRPIPLKNRRSAALESVAYISGLNVTAVLGDALRVAKDEPLGEAHACYCRLRSTPYRVFLLSGPLGLQPYVSNLSDPGAVPAPSLLAAMDSAARHDAGTAGSSPIAKGEASPAWLIGEDEETRRLREALRRRLDRVERRRSALQRQLAAGADAEDIRQIGHLLLARQSNIQRGRRRVTVEDFEGQPRVIELNPALSVTDNAAEFYSEARKRERAVRLLPDKIQRDEQLIERLGAALESLDNGEPSSAAWDLVGGRRTEGAGSAGGPLADRRGATYSAGKDPSVNLPYRSFHSSGGLEIRVGRSARGNDELTFRHASPEDIWMHARQVSGAHVVLRWGRRDQNPPRRDLLEAAAVAACHSDARHSGIVAVDWTRKKHVRKPRKSAPGAVVPARTQTVFVAPDRDLVKRLSEDY